MGHSEQLERIEALKVCSISTQSMLPYEGMLDAINDEASELARIFDACPEDDLIMYHVDHCMILGFKYEAPVADIMRLVEDALQHNHGYFLDRFDDGTNRFVKR